MSAVCIVQARAGSRRLPGKVLAPLGGIPMLELILQRLRPANVPLVLATSSLPVDDPVATLGDAAGVEVVRGPEDDVLARFLLALESHEADDVVRITGDCPFTDSSIVRAVLDQHRAHANDYTSNIHPRTFPKGLDVEVASASALRAAAARATIALEREHVMPHLYRHPETFRLGGLWGRHRLGHLRWTVDTQDDLDVVRRMAEGAPNLVAAPWESLLSDADRPEPRPFRLRPADAERSAMARDRLGMPWAIDHDLVDAAGDVAGTAAVGIESASALVELSIVDERRLGDAVQAVVDDLAAGVQADDITIRCGHDVIRRALR